MFLAINLNAAKAKKRKKEEQRRIAKQQITKSGGVGNTMAMEMTKQKTANLDNIIEENATRRKCENCQHLLSSTGDQWPQQRHSSLGDEYSRFPLTPSTCLCDCACVYKEQPSAQHQHRDSLTSNATTLSDETKATTKTSLFIVYMCLGALTFAVATLAVLFFSHVTSQTTDDDTLSWRSQTNEFRVNFQRELAASGQMLHNMMVQIIKEQQMAVHNQTTKHYTEPNAADLATSSNTAPLDNENSKTTGTTTTTRMTTQGMSIVMTLPTKAKSEVKMEAGDERKYSENGDYIDVVKLSRTRRDIPSSPSSMHADPFVEFFNPNHRKALEEQDMEIRKRTGLKGAAPGGDEWIYLNSYCRVPDKIITGFCKGTQEYCPPSPQGPVGPMGPKGPAGPPGLPGLLGPKGFRGDVGIPGPAGLDGPIGPPGPRGPKGDLGIPGRAGLDGRDGVPGEPGLDGVPGRSGADGIPGKDGLPGRDGRDGHHGKDGKDGTQGPKGVQGPPGERGLKGIAGPRGRPGKSGTNGTPGTPGVNTWKIQLPNGTWSNELLIPPSIADANAPHIQRVIIVEENKTLNMSCASAGNPTPHVEWRRDDGRTIYVQGMEMSSVSGQFLRFTNITRNQMAAYTCFADNGIPPVANATFLVEVHFAPMITVYRQMIYAEYGHTATLECLVEAFPEAIRYWERAYDGKILDPGEKYRIESYPDGFKTTMRLTINNLRKDDFGYYHCVARNELNATMVNFEVAPQDPNSETPYVGKEIKIFGQRPPDLGCPVCENCPDPSLYQCKDSINSNFDIQPTGNFSYPGLPKRQKSCLLYAVGKPVFHKAVNENYGSWLRDSAAKEIDREKTFTTNENDSYNLYEYLTKIRYRMNAVPRKNYEIKGGFYGNAHIVYNGSFYYHQRNKDLVVRMQLNTLEKTSVQLPYAGIAAGNKLYSTDYNYMDFNVDEVGLWVIYSTYDSNNTLVAHLDADTLRVRYNFNITLDHKKFGEMFIVCGHLYAIDSCTEKNSQIRYVVDLYNGKLLNVDLPFSNPFRKTTTVGYNPHTVELYSWDKGNALTYPIRYHEQILTTDHV